MVFIERSLSGIDLMLPKFIYKLMGFKHAEEFRKGNETILVLENEGVKKVMVNGATYSLIKSDIYTNSYWDYFIPLAGLYEKPRILMIGLGAGTVVYQINNVFPAANIDVVEIDSGMAEIAKRLNPKMRANVIIGDGAAYVEKVKRAYDLLILDAYKGIEIPGVFMQDKFIIDARSALKETGIMAINYARSVSRFAELQEYVAKLKTEFDVYIVRAKPTTENVILICANGTSDKELLEGVKRGMSWDSRNSFLLRSYEGIREL